MLRKDQKIIFLNSFLPRTGHNFVSEVIKIFSNHQVLINPRSETKISTLLDSYYEIYFTGILNNANRTFFDHLFIDNLRERILSSSTQNFIMIKDTTFIGVNYIPKVFPEDIQLILIRDPYNVFLSLLKAMDLQKKNYKNFIKSLLFPTGIYPYLYSRRLSEKILRSFPDLKNKNVIKYEDLVQKNTATLKLFKRLFNSEIELEVAKKHIDNIKVINSSFYEETKGNRIWDMQPKTKEYNPLKREYRNFLVGYGIRLGSRKLRKKLNYI